MFKNIHLSRRFYCTSGSLSLTAAPLPPTLIAMDSKVLQHPQHARKICVASRPTAFVLWAASPLGTQVSDSIDKSRAQTTTLRSNNSTPAHVTTNSITVWLVVLQVRHTNKVGLSHNRVLCKCALVTGS